ncbi:ubiquinol-cytochrome c reductase iron-sulfur subunit [Tunturiibacter gelidoferens]|uniref:Rieske Fe-S protein n=1 Tax=Tunturiibacter gelidiferens TaxID=3069689 RepID=A0ACC5NYM2_9BACT|nr:Rieske 2Fe-2S domain-containing protein [Edaphobacter lichenicola]MBB5339519.1 Rieske Fe-S protein [Edaphobacter lichenicola]
MIPSEQLPPTDQTLTEPHPDSVKDPSIAAGHSRRVFLFKLALAVNGLVGFVLAIPIVGYLLGPALKKTSSDNSWINLGPLADFPEGETRLVNYRNPITNQWDGQTGDIPCWVRRVSGDTFQVFAINCAHLGCPVRWFAQSKLFLCPCHGGAYYADGARASGPPERGLFEYQHKVSNGTLMISAGRMPTLANEAKMVTPLTQIETQIDGSTAARIAARLNTNDQPQPRCSSCQT